MHALATFHLFLHWEVKRGSREVDSGSATVCQVTDGVGEGGGNGEMTGERHSRQR